VFIFKCIFRVSVDLSFLSKNLERTFSSIYSVEKMKLIVMKERK